MELAAMAGLELDPWQQFVLRYALGERPDGKWSAFEVGVEVARQNGKGGVLEGRELAGLFILGERLLIHSAHEFATSLEAFHRMLALIESCPDLDQMVKRVSRSHGDEGIELKTGQRLRYRTRTKGGGRGFSCDCLILDEAMEIPEPMHGALMPTLSARPNPQVWYAGSAVDQQTMDHGRVFARVRRRALSEEPGALAYFGWSPPYDSPDDVDEEAAADPENWAMANPGLGIRISLEHVGREQQSMSPRTFAVERLGVGDWPTVDGSESQLIDRDVWAALADGDSTIAGPVRFAFDVAPDRSTACIAAAGKRADGLHHVEVIDHRRGTDWIVGRLEQLLEGHGNAGVVCDARGPASALLADLADRRIVPDTLSAQEYAQACGVFFDAATQNRLRHLGTHELKAAVAGAATRPLGDAWAWSRKSSAVDITPLVACTLPLFGGAGGTSAYEDGELLIL